MKNRYFINKRNFISNKNPVIVISLQLVLSFCLFYFVFNFSFLLSFFSFFAVFFANILLSGALDVITKGLSVILDPFNFFKAGFSIELLNVFLMSLLCSISYAFFMHLYFATAVLNLYLMLKVFLVMLVSFFVLNFFQYDGFVSKVVDFPIQINKFFDEFARYLLFVFKLDYIVEKIFSIDMLNILLASLLLSITYTLGVHLYLATVVISFNLIHYYFLYTFAALFVIYCVYDRLNFLYNFSFLKKEGDFIDIAEFINNNLEDTPSLSSTLCGKKGSDINVLRADKDRVNHIYLDDKESFSNSCFEKKHQQMSYTQGSFSGACFTDLSMEYLWIKSPSQITRKKSKFIYENESKQAFGFSICLHICKASQETRVFVMFVDDFKQPNENKKGCYIATFYNKNNNYGIKLLQQEINKNIKSDNVKKLLLQKLFKADGGFNENGPEEINKVFSENSCSQEQLSKLVNC